MVDRHEVNLISEVSVYSPVLVFETSSGEVSPQKRIEAFARIDGPVLTSIYMPSVFFSNSMDWNRPRVCENYLAFTDIGIAPNK